jgi:hypothetical protein
MPKTYSFSIIQEDYLWAAAISGATKIKISQQDFNFLGAQWLGKQNIYKVFLNFILCWRTVQQLF